MTYYIKRGNNFVPTPEEAVDIRQQLPVGTYTVKVDDNGNYFLSIIDNFQVVGKQYGNNQAHATRIINTFSNRSNSTGVMMVGEKGSGKSLLAKTVSVMARDQSIATIVVNTPFFGDNFNQFIQTIDQPVVIIFDEFEKVYDREDQEKILTLLDGTYPTKKLFILTCNNKYRVDINMKNRPGRIYYMIEFNGLEEQFIREYCADNLKDPSSVDRTCAISNMFGQFNFDMLQALVAEMNLYGEGPEEAIKMLNVKPELDDGSGKFLVELIDSNGESVNLRLGDTFTGNPLIETHDISYRSSSPSGDEDGTVYLEIGPKNLYRVEAATGIYEFKLKNNITVKYTRDRSRMVDIWASAF